MDAQRYERIPLPTAERCGQKCQERLLRADMNKDKPSVSLFVSNFLKIGGRALTLPFALLGAGCGGDDDSGNNGGNNNINNNNNNVDLDGSVDVFDASPLDDGHVPFDGDVDADGDGGVECTPNADLPAIEGGTNIVADNATCDPADLVYHDLSDNILAICKHPNNRLISFDPTTSGVAMLGQMSVTANGQQVHGQSLYPFTSPFNAAKDLIAVPFQTVDVQHPNDVYSGSYMFDFDTGSQLDTISLSFQILCGGCPTEGTYNIQGASGAAFSTLDDSLYVANENPRTDGTGYVSSFIPALELQEIGTTPFFVHGSQPKLAIPGGYRAAGITALSDGTLAVAVSGLANNNPPAPPKLVFMDPSSGTVPIATTRSIELSLPADETLVPLPRVAHINEQSYVMVATDGITGTPAQRLVVVHRDLPTSETIHDQLDLTPYAKGPVTDVLVDETNSMIYVIARGNSTEDGSITGISIAANGTPTVTKHQSLGGLAGKAELDPLSTPRKIYVHVQSRSDCDAVNAGNTGPQLLTIDVNSIPSA